MLRRELLRNAAVLLGGVASSSLANAVLSGIDGRNTIEKPVMVSAQRKKTMILAEMIIPRTDTPGAIDAGVPHFIELMVSDWYTDREREIYFAGLLELDRCCQSRFGGNFLAVTPEQRIEALSQAEADSENYRSPQQHKIGAPEDEEKPFFIKIKELTVLGYFTSQLGATEELRYDPMPMRSGDIDLIETDGRQWSS